MRVQADFDLCEANALCVGIAPETFELDDDDFLFISGRSKELIVLAGGKNVFLIGEDERAMYAVLQLAHVSWPLAQQTRLDEAGSDAERGADAPYRRGRQKGARHRGRGHVAQRREA